MSSYPTIDYLPDLTKDEINNAGILKFEPHSTAGTGWDNQAFVYGFEKSALLHAYYRFNATEGATYDITTGSFFDPYLLRIYDKDGNTIVANDEADDVFLKTNTTYLTDQIYGWVAPYTGTYYIDASWNQGSFYTDYFLFVNEDVDTIPPTPTPTTEPSPPHPAIKNIDRIYNWAESVHKDLFPEHQDSQANIFGYYARIYSNGGSVSV